MAQDEGELIRLALEQLPAGVVVADAHDNVVTLNAQARVSGLQRQVAALQDALQERFVDGMITLVGALEARDRYTYGHSTQVAFLAGKVARGVLGHAADVSEIRLDSEAG